MSNSWAITYTYIYTTQALHVWGVKFSDYYHTSLVDYCTCD